MFYNHDVYHSIWKSSVNINLNDKIKLTPFTINFSSTRTDSEEPSRKDPHYNLSQCVFRKHFCKPSVVAFQSPHFTGAE